MRVPSLILAVCLAATAQSVAHAEAFVEPASGTTFERHPSSDGKAFLCLGAGIRKYLVFNVYAMDFCVEEAKARSELDAYFAGPGARFALLKGQALAKGLADDVGFFEYVATMAVEKRAEMVFLRGSGAATIRNSFTKNLEKALGSSPQTREAIRDFVSPVDHDIQSGDRALFLSRPGGELTFSLDSQSKTLKHDRVEATFWESYLGPDSPLPSLKEAVAQGVAGLRP
jgi:hypothetical protein